MPRKKAYPENGRTEEPRKRNWIQLNTSLINGILKKYEIMSALGTSILCTLQCKVLMYNSFNVTVTELKCENYRVPVNG